MADNISVDVSTVDLTEGKTADAVVSNIIATTATVTVDNEVAGLEISTTGAGGPFSSSIAPFDLDGEGASTITNSNTTWDTDHAVLNGTNATLQVPNWSNLDGAQNASIYVRFKLTATPTLYTAIANIQVSGFPTSTAIGIYARTDGALDMLCGVGGGDYSLFTTSNIYTDGNWHSALISKNGASGNTFYETDLESSTLAKPVANLSTLNADGISIGRNDPTSTRYLSAHIEEFKLWSTTKTIATKDIDTNLEFELGWSGLQFYDTVAGIPTPGETKTLTFRHDSDSTTLSIPSQMTISGTNDVDIYAEVEPANSFGNVNKGTCSSVYTLKVENIDSISRDVTGITAPTGFECKKSTDSTWSSSIPSFTITSGSYENIDFRSCTPEIGDVSGEATLSYNPTLSILLSVTSIASDFACTLITTHVDDAKDRLIRQYKQGSNVEDVAGALVTPIQQSENDLYELYSLDDIDVMIGTQLDMIGATIGQDRQGFLDDDYRILLKARIAINSSRGTLDDLLSIWNILNPSQTTEILEQFPAQIELKTTLTWATVQQADMAFEAMEQAVAAGVRIVWITPITTIGDGIFKFDSTDSADYFDNGDFTSTLNS